MPLAEQGALEAADSLPPAHKATPLVPEAVLVTGIVFCQYDWRKIRSAFAVEAALNARRQASLRIDRFIVVVVVFGLDFIVRAG